MDVYAVRDDTSETGMRRQHLMQMGAEIDSEEVIKAEFEDGWRLETWYQWKDADLDIHHFYAAWRSEMVNHAMMVYTVGKGGMLDAISRASRLYLAKFGAAPNWMLVREETWQDRGADRVAMNVEGVEQEIQVKMVKKGWQTGVVGVWRE
jgi:hypothetical protein